VDESWFRWALGVSEMTTKKLICDVCKKKQWGLSMLQYEENSVGVCNDCYEVWDTIEIKLNLPRHWPADEE
jgi:hypothetical protein